MAMNKMNIPQTIRVGYQERRGTYTGKLAYVIYIDEKGRVRKETSWQSWRSKKIEPEDFKNEPTEGFVLNKKAGGEKYSWNTRQTYARVYDPRGFEFEISIPNLLFILQETSCTKGKGLEGKFVYAWDGTELVLLPVGCEEYKACSVYTAHQSGRVTKNEMVEGRSYLMKDMTEVMYLGRHDYKEKKHNYRAGVDEFKPKGKKHIFKRIAKENNWQSDYIIQTGFTKLAAVIDEDIHPDFPDEYEKLVTSPFVSDIIEVDAEPKKLTKIRLKKNYGRAKALIKDGDEYYPVEIIRPYNYGNKGGPTKYELWKGSDPVSWTLTDNMIEVPTVQKNYGRPPRNGNWNDRKKLNCEELTETQLFKKQFYAAMALTEAGGKFNLLRDY